MSATNNHPANNNTSTLKGAYDTVTGAAQEAAGRLTGNTNDEARGLDRQDQGSAERDMSHATAKGPGFTASGSGAVAKDDPDRTTGSYNQTMGSAKEMVGNMTGNESMKASGREQNLEGQRQEAKGQISDYASGVGDRVQGTFGSAVAGLTGDRSGQEHYNQLHAEGKTQQRGAEHDIQKQAEAERRT